MRVKVIQLCILLFAFILSVGLLVASVEYAALAEPLVVGGENVHTYWISLVFYLGAIPLLSTIVNGLHILAFHFGAISLPSTKSPTTPIVSSSSRQKLTTAINNIVIPHSFILIVTIFQGIAWLAQCTITTACELKPILQGHQGHVPDWCPQTHLHDLAQDDNPKRITNMALIATGKDIIQWLMFVTTLAMIECARRIWVRYPYEKDYEFQPTNPLNDYVYQYNSVTDRTNITAPGLRVNPPNTSPNRKSGIKSNIVLYVNRKSDDMRTSMKFNTENRRPPPVPLTLPARAYQKPTVGQGNGRSYESRI